MIKRLWERIRPKTDTEREHEYLSEAVDMVDLERRLNILGHNPSMFKW